MTDYSIKVSKKPFFQKLVCEYKPPKNIVLTGHKVNESLVLLNCILSKNIPFLKYFELIHDTTQLKSETAAFETLHSMKPEYPIGKTWVRYHMYNTVPNSNCFDQIKLTHQKNMIAVIGLIVKCPYCTNLKQNHENDTTEGIMNDMLISKNLIINYILIGIPVIIMIDHINVNDNSIVMEHFFSTVLEYQGKHKNVRACKWLMQEKEYNQIFMDLMNFDTDMNGHYYCESTPYQPSIESSTKYNIRMINISTRTGLNIDAAIDILQKKAINNKKNTILTQFTI